MKNKSLIKEVKHFQKIAGLIKENEGAQWMSKLNPEVNGIEIYNDGDNRLFVIFDKNTGGIHVVNDWNGEDFDEVWGTDTDVRPELLAALKGGGMKEDYHPDDPAGWDSAAARGEDDYEGEDEEDEWANIPNTVEGWVDYLYTRANPKQKAKLANIYREQMKNEGVEDAYEFFTDLIDSSDPDAIIDLRDLNQYSGY